MIQSSTINWNEDGQDYSAVWRSENGIAAHKKVVTADDTLTADDAYHLACEGTAILWRGDFQNARQLLQALVRRVDKPSKKSQRASKRVVKPELIASPKSAKDIFNQHRLIQ